MGRSGWEGLKGAKGGKRDWSLGEACCRNQACFVVSLFAMTFLEVPFIYTGLWKAFLDYLLIFV